MNNSKLLIEVLDEIAATDTEITRLLAAKAVKLNQLTQEIQKCTGKPTNEVIEWERCKQWCIDKELYQEEDWESAQDFRVEARAEGFSEATAIWKEERAQSIADLENLRAQLNAPHSVLPWKRRCSDLEQQLDECKAQLAAMRLQASDAANAATINGGQAVMAEANLESLYTAAVRSAVAMENVAHHCTVGNFGRRQSACAKRAKELRVVLERLVTIGYVKEERSDDKKTQA